MLINDVVSRKLNERFLGGKREELQCIVIDRRALTTGRSGKSRSLRLILSQRLEPPE